MEKKMKSRNLLTEDVYVIKTDYFGDDYAYLGNGGRSWVTKDSSTIDKFLGREIAEKKAKEQSRKYKAYVVPMTYKKLKEPHGDKR